MLAVGFDSKLKRDQFVAREGCTCMLWMFCRAGNIEVREKTRKKQKVIKAGKSFIILNELLALKT